MATILSAADSAPPYDASSGVGPFLRRFAFLIAAVVAWIAPALIALGDGYWSTAQGAQGPIILMTGGWALTWDLSRNRTLHAPGSTALTVILLLVAIAFYVLARMMGMLTLECLAALAGVVAILFHQFGGRALRAAWVPLVYLLCLVPPPFTLSLQLTRALKLALSDWSVVLLDILGYRVAFSGSALYIDQYEVVMEAACSGLNSLFSLAAIGFFYVFWQRRGDWGHAMCLMLLVVPLAILANLVRVVLLLALVQRFGPAILDSMLHPMAGFAMFVVALSLLVFADLTGRRLRGLRGWR